MGWDRYILYAKMHRMILIIFYFRLVLVTANMEEAIWQLTHKRMITKYLQDKYW